MLQSFTWLTNWEEITLMILRDTSTLQNIFVFPNKWENEKNQHKTNTEDNRRMTRQTK